MKNITITLIDGYVDEPSCLGVPPYISPYIRYTYGALLDAEIDEKNITYLTIDNLRQEKEKYFELLQSQNYIIIIAGTTVPGRYMGGKPASIQEIKEISSQIHKKSKVFLGGPLLLCLKDISGINLYLDETGALGCFEYFAGKSVSKNNITAAINRWAELGAKVTNKHPFFPNIICEVETYRGCPRFSNCAFCSEKLKKIIYQRSPQAVSEEIKKLYETGNKFFRLGAQTDLFMYGAVQNSSKKLIPNPENIFELYNLIHKKAPQHSVLHMDNTSPGTIARFPDESRKILQIITSHNTPGDTAAFGLESADPEVLKRNNIDTDPQETLQAVKVMNEIGGKRKEGLPLLLPGINILHGLKGETKDTYEYNLEYLQKILHQGLMVRRINIRQVRPISDYKPQKINTKLFKNYKEKVNEEINKPMLQRVFPEGTILKNVLLEKISGNITYGRQLGTYPILIGVPGKHTPGTFVNVRIVEHGYRSLTGLLYPFNINKAAPEELQSLPGIGKKRAKNIFLALPVNSLYELSNILDNSVDITKISAFIDDFS